MFMEARERRESWLCLAVWLSGLAAFVMGYLCFVSSRHALERAVGSCSTSVSAEPAVRNSARCADEDEMSDAQCQSFSAIDVDSLVNVRDSPIPMSIVSAVSLESHPAGRSEM